MQREDFYRVRAEGTNTLVIDLDKEPGQPPDAMAVFKSFESFESSPASSKAVLDLTRAYEEHARRVERTFELVRNETADKPSRPTATTVSRIINASVTTKAKPLDLW